MKKFLLRTIFLEPILHKISRKMYIKIPIQANETQNTTVNG